MMRPCEKCLENSWSYEFTRETLIEGSKGTVTATCKHCGHEVQFQSWKKKFESNIPRNEYVIHRKPKRKHNMPAAALQPTIAGRWSPLDCGAGNDPNDVPWDE
jgi:hypothetical protein